jgi:hypothetical protein
MDENKTNITNMTVDMGYIVLIVSVRDFRSLRFFIGYKILKMIGDKVNIDRDYSMIVFTYCHSSGFTLVLVSEGFVDVEKV